MIRSITIGLPLDELSTADIDDRARALLEASGETLKRHGIAPRTARFTLPARMIMPSLVRRSSKSSRWQTHSWVAAQRSSARQN